MKTTIKTVKLKKQKAAIVCETCDTFHLIGQHDIPGFRRRHARSLAHRRELVASRPIRLGGAA